MNLSVGILCGGKSRRMGQNKALMEINQKSFLHTIVDELAGFKQLLVSVNDAKDYPDLLFPMVEDEFKGIGPIEGIRCLLTHSQTEYMFICATDMPFLKKELVQYMQEYISSDYDCYVICDEKRIHPLCAIYSREMLDTIEQLSGKGQYKLTKLLNAVRTKYIQLRQSCFSEKLVRNINTKEEYREAVKPLVFCISGIKDSGKTGLIVRLINEFIDEYPRIGVIKHDGHDFCMDHENTDTDRFVRAGAVGTAIYSGVQCAVIRRDHNCQAEDLLRGMQDMDLVILEGLKNSKYPKIEVIRKERTEGVCDVNTLIGIATNREDLDGVKLYRNKQVPILHLDDTKAIADQIRYYFHV